MKTAPTRRSYTSVQNERKIQHRFKNENFCVTSFLSRCAKCAKSQKQQTSPHTISHYASLPKRNMQNLSRKVWFESIKLFCRSMKLFCYHYLKNEQIFSYCNAINYYYPRCLDLYSSINITGVIKSRKMRSVGHVASKGAWRGRHRIFVGSPEDKGSLGRPRYRGKNNVTMDLQEVGCGELTGLIWLRMGTSGGNLWRR